MTSSSDNLLFGVHPIKERLNSNPQSIERIYLDANRRSQQNFEILKISRKKKIPTQHIPENKLNQLARTSKHQGIVAITSVKNYVTETEVYKRVESSANPLLLVAASIEDPQNLGAIIRSSVAFGITALLLERRNTVPLNATVSKASAGMLEHITVCKPYNLEGMIVAFKEKGFAVVGASEAAQAPLYDVDLRGPTILIMGGEHRGIPAYLQKSCSTLVSIPMAGKVQSLNVSAAASIFLYETSRQRGFAFKD
ncbi:MAG: 23S rRNA (guanosine(2251)-2'-O)-methyltransferase RlmB [Fibrobacterota bacterium]